MGTFKELEDGMLDNLDRLDKADLAKERHIVISTSLIPECQRSLIEEINRRSKDAFKAGHTKDQIEIMPLSYIQNVKSNFSSSCVVLLEKSEADLYRGGEKRLVFEREGDSPVMVNGLVAAGRAVLYNDMERLGAILSRLSSDENIKLPGSVELERLVNEDRKKFADFLTITLPAISILGKEMGELNRNMLKVMQYA
jgi:hypothetical protein